MKRTRTLPSNLRLFGLVLCGLVLSACSQEAPTEATSQVPAPLNQPLRILPTLCSEPTFPAMAVGQESDIAEILKQTEAGLAVFQWELGTMYGRGEDVPQDDVEAVKWYRLAADRGHACAQFDLGAMYANGNGVSQDDVEAVKWYRLAAEQGHAQAQTVLGLMYATGNGVPEDDAEAAKWYRLAAEQGHANAQGSLGLRYVTGRGVPVDLVAAHAWLNIASASGNEKAREGKSVVESIMTPAQISEAQQLSTEIFERIQGNQ